jgi:serine/threonine protein kinase
VTIAVKEIPIKNPSEVQPLREEIQLHSLLRHRNIVQYLGCVCEDNTFKIFMERVPGGSLSQLLRSKWGPLNKNEQTIVYYTRQILHGLRYLHSQKIVHRDIKGDNILVNTYSGDVKISDFGTSKRLAGLNPRTETFTGTFQYMAPEVIDQGQRGYGAPADIWSLGCTVVEMATGKIPFIEISSGPEIIFKVGYYKEHPLIPENMSDKAKQFILKCFEPDPEKRWTASQLLEDVFIVDPKENRKKPPPAPNRSSVSGIPGNYVTAGPSNGFFEFSRSISVPTGAVASPVSGQAATNVSAHGSVVVPPNSNVTVTAATTDATIGKLTRCVSNEERVHGASNESRPSAQKNLKLNIKSAVSQTHHQLLGVGLVTNGAGAHMDCDSSSPSVNTPGSFEESPKLSRRRATSSECIASPPVDTSGGSTGLSTDTTLGAISAVTPGSASIQGGAGGGEERFFLLKKDSQRRSTLVQVMTESADSICSTWFVALEQKLSGSRPLLTVTHLEQLLSGFRGYMPDQNHVLLADQVEHVRRSLCEHPLANRSEAIRQLELGVILAQEAINSTLRTRNIKPHWMFALDNLVKSVIYAALNIISPELSRNLAETPVSAGSISRQTDGESGELESGTSSPLLNGSAPVTRTASGNLRPYQQLRLEYNELKTENWQLWQELVNTERTLNELLASRLNERRLHVQLMCGGTCADSNGSVSGPTVGLSNGELGVGLGSGAGSSCTSTYEAGSESRRTSALESGSLPPIADAQGDEQLIEWLNDIQCDPFTVQKFVGEDFTLENVLYDMTRDDLRKLGLRVGVEIKIWKQIVRNRAIKRDPDSDS